jgi:MinD-like ATPase involved in chromosome partitioning or flagellar assembly/DNA-binding NarL/FixJ family response regulator
LFIFHLYCIWILVLHIKGYDFSYWLGSSQKAIGVNYQYRYLGGIKMGHIIAVYGAHGGAGATTLAVNLAVRLKQLKARVLILDMNLHQGDIPAYLKMQFQYTLLDGMTSDIDTDRLDEIVLTHDSGIKVLMALPLPTDAKFVLENMDKLALLLDVIQSEYDLIVVDIGRYPDAVTLEILKRAISVILVMQPTLPAARNASFVLDWFRSDLAFPEDKIVTVLNQVNNDFVSQKLMIPTNQIEKLLKLKFEAQLPLDAPTALNAIAKGQPITQNPRSPNALAQALDDFGRFVFDMLVYNDDDIPDDFRPTRAALFSQRLEADHNVSKSDKIYSNRSEPITILIVHVIEEVRTNLAKLLAFESDMNVIGGVGSASEALTMAKELRPNIILMQVDMPETDVIQSMIQIRAAVPKTSIILLTTENIDVDLMRQAEQAGAQFFLTIPVAMDELYNIIRMIDNKAVPRRIDTIYDWDSKMEKFYKELEHPIILRPAPDKEAAHNPHPTDPRPVKLRPANPEAHGSRPSFVDSILFRQANTASPTSKPPTSRDQTPNSNDVQTPNKGSHRPTSAPPPANAIDSVDDDAN